MDKYVAFLRGINVGGRKKIKMAELQEAFESSGFQNIKTVLASGNVLFETPKTNTNVLIKNIEENLKKTFGFEVGVIVRTLEDIQKLVDVNPFKNIKVTPQTILYVTFLSEKPNNRLNIPYESPNKDFKILSVSESEVLSVLILTSKFNTTDSMKILEKEFGKKITTRNWNTLKKITEL
ncbi:MAG: DUF1697 domain-containing protein [Thermodesulfobacteriota bacterium]